MVRNLSLFAVLLSLTFPAFADEYKSAYDRVMKTQTIRCGYKFYAPYFEKDANTGEFSGIFYDLTEELAKNAGLKVEWTEEVAFDDTFTGLKANRYDSLCSGMWPSVLRSKVGSFTIPIAYNVVTAWGRVDEKRFQNLKGINSPEVKVATIDGAMEDIIAQTDYPLASRVSSPGLTSFTDNFIKISTKKADITFVESSLVRDYIAANPNTLKQLSPIPLRTFGVSLAVAKGEHELKEIFDVGLTELLNSGRVEAILQKYEKYPGSFMRVAKPYEMPK